MSRRAGTTFLPTLTIPASVPASLIVAYVLAMPLLAGIPRGSIIPLLRPSEVLQLLVTGGAVAVAALAIIGGQRWRLQVRPVEWWLLAVAATASALPVLWLLARGLSVSQEDLLGALPFIKYVLLYFLVRGCVTSNVSAETLSKAVVVSASLITVIAITQSLNVGPVVDVLSRYYVSGVEDLVDEGRGTTTLGSSIATGAMLSFGCGLALSWAMATGKRMWFLAAVFLAVGTLASGQAGSVIALAAVVGTVAYLHGRAGQLLRWGIPAGVLAVAALWPVVAARLTDIDQGTGLPSSWIIRWNNISELYLPALADGGWILGVRPDAIVTPPDVWRQSVYLESGYLWLLWVGGVPLLAATLGLMMTAWKSLGQTTETPAGSTNDTAPMSHPDDAASRAIPIAARGAVVMMLLLSIIDPHLTLRGGADLFFILIALGHATSPLAVQIPAIAGRWRILMQTPDGPDGRVVRARVQIAESSARTGGEPAHPALVLKARVDGKDVGDAMLSLRRTADGLLRGCVVLSAQPDRGIEAVIWRNVALVARSLRLVELNTPIGLLTENEIKLAARSARQQEADREATLHRVTRETGASMTALASPTSSESPHPGLRLSVVEGLPGWKRLIDVLLASVALVMTSPLWLLAVLMVRRSGPGPVLYRQIRVGSGGLPFQIYKFRTMYVDNDDTAHREQNRKEILENAEASKDDADPRITPAGRVLRRTSLDELPQLINVLRSEMSLVGPRPSLLWETELFEPASRRRLQARPGITGLWQINGRADLSMTEMLELDLAYLERMGPALDIKCLAKTATSVVGGEGAK